ncbi:response regulator with CheY-like receiver domain and winged-helix DNA-binding domain [Methanolobus tindarius DSM 2278]|uniref:Response regulator with CheY-like receiver domain and winged-helix DNA-binding domain n=1 Tax=Methanolobus tindarius DSM 2278 TaxID=1090322 RepID=W9DQR9_METTI|nr:response regulator [Methanolobus tindarius]ETA67730.1 response regulator with CheY-like receiver domain and winged-helix DNA-binding domain [Methanolobus tindarius DSM 2278]
MFAENEVEIVLVEDNPNDRELALRALKKNKIANNIVVLEDGEQAIDYLYGRGEFGDRDINVNPRLVLLDLKLPKMDGLDVLKVIKSDPDKKMIPVVMLTSSKEESDVVESYRLGVNSYIVKPVDFDNFVEAIRNIGFYWLLMNESPNKKE